MALKVSTDMQEAIISALMKDSYLFSAVRSEKINEAYFPDPSCKIIFKAISNYYKKYDGLPEYKELLISIDDSYYDSVGVDIKTVKDLAEKLSDYPELDESFIKDQLTSLVRKIRTNKTLSGFLDKVKSGDNMTNDDLVNELSKSLDINFEDAKVFLMTDAEQVKEARISAIGTTTNSKIIKSSIPAINGYLQYGGWQPSTVNMIVGVPGCFTGDTKILLKDESKTFEELYDSKEDLNIYGCSDNGLIESGIAESVYLSDYTDKLLIITVTNILDSYDIKCTYDHPFLLSDGEYRIASDLLIHDELMTVDKNSKRVINFRVSKISKLNLDTKVPVYGLVNAGKYHNYALSLSDNKGIFVSNSGKSMFLLNEGAYAAKQGFKVLHIFIGDMVEYDGFVRYLSLISGTSQDEIIIMPQDRQMELVKFCNQQYNNIFDRIHILAYPSNTINVSELAENISRVEKQNKIDYDMIVIDYPDNFIRTGGSSMYEEGGELYSALEKLFRNTRAVGMIATQPKQYYWGSEILPLESAGESSRKQHAIDVMVTMGLVTRDANVGSFFMAKVRRGKVGQIIRFKTDYKRCKIEEIGEVEYNTMKADFITPKQYSKQN